MLSFEKKLWIIQQKEKKVLTDSEIASVQKISRRHVQRLWVKYQNYGEDIFLEKPRGRKVDEIPKLIQDKVLELRKNNYGIRKIEGLLKQENLNLSKRKIIRILKQNKLHIFEPKKSRRYDYVRWERDHSNSLWQTDYCWIEKLGCWLTGWLDDHSRLITSSEYITEATTETSLRLFEKGVKKFGLPREVLSDRGTQYYSPKGERCYYREYLESLGVKVIYASVKKPTTCGKLERFWKTHNLERWNYSSLKKFIEFYNYKRPHMSLGWKPPYEIWKKDFKV